MAAEDSAAAYICQLFEYWKQTGQDFEAFGVGSDPMIKYGFTALAKPSELAVQGFYEIFKRYRFIKKIFYLLLKSIKQNKPDVILLVDYPGFNLRLVQKIKNIPVIYFIPPKIWAGRERRIEILKKHCTKILSILPFEDRFFTSPQFEYIGNPLADTIYQEKLNEDEKQELRTKRGLSKKDRVIALLPGSRNMEVRMLLPEQLKIARNLFHKDKNLHFLLILAPSIKRKDITPHLKGIDFPLSIVETDSNKILQIIDFGICCSGTISLTLGLLLKPMVAMYKMQKMEIFLIKLIISKKLKFFSLPNIILNRGLIPEFIQKDINIEGIANYVRSVLQDPHKHDEIIKGLKSLNEQMPPRNAIHALSKHILNYKSI